MASPTTDQIADEIENWHLAWRRRGTGWFIAYSVADAPGDWELFAVLRRGEPVETFTDKVCAAAYFRRARAEAVGKLFG